MISAAQDKVDEAKAAVTGIASDVQNKVGEVRKDAEAVVASVTSTVKSTWVYKNGLKIVIGVGVGVGVVGMSGFLLHSYGRYVILKKAMS